MAEGLPSSFKLNNSETVDTVFSPILVENLFKDNTFKPGVTFTDKYNERAGQIYARRLGKTAASVKIATSAGGLDLQDATETADSLVLIQKTDAISRNEKCYELVSQLRASGKSVDKVAEVVAEFKEACQIVWMSYFFKATASANQVEIGGASRSSNTTASTTLAGVVADILADREQIRVNGGTADVLIISPQIETLFLSNAIAAGNAFIPETNEELLKEGRLGRLYGMKVYTSNLIGSGTPITVPVAGNAPANTGDAYNCEYIIYNHDAFAIAMDIEGLRLKDALTFMGSLAQIQGLSGGGVTNPALAIAKVVTP